MNKSLRIFIIALDAEDLRKPRRPYHILGYASVNLFKPSGKGANPHLPRRWRAFWSSHLCLQLHLLTIMTASLIGLVIERFMVIPKKRNTCNQGNCRDYNKPVNISYNFLFLCIICHYCFFLSLKHFIYRLKYQRPEIKIFCL